MTGKKLLSGIEKENGDGKPETGGIGEGKRIGNQRDLPFSGIPSPAFLPPVI